MPFCGVEYLFFGTNREPKGKEVLQELVVPKVCLETQDATESQVSLELGYN